MGGGGVGEKFSSRRNFFSLSNSLYQFFLEHEYFLGLIGMHEFFSFNFALREYFFGTSLPPPPPISFLMVRPLYHFLWLQTDIYQTTVSCWGNELLIDVNDNRKPPNDFQRTKDNLSSTGIILAVSWQ